MDIRELKRCRYEDDFSDLMMKDFICGYDNPVTYPDYKLIAIVDHAASYNIRQLKSFFKTVHNELEVQFVIGDGVSLVIDGTRFHRSFLYSNKLPLISKLFDDGIFRMQEPMIERYDGITIDLKDLTITFKNDGEVLSYDSTEALNKAINRISAEYWPDLAHPDIKIRDSISNHPGTKWLVEAISDQLMTFDTCEKGISLVKRFEEFIPGLNIDFHPEDYIPFKTSLQIALLMKNFEIEAQNEIIKNLLKCFGFFDDYFNNFP